MEVRIDFANQQSEQSPPKYRPGPARLSFAINFRMMGLPSWGPLTINGNGKLDRKMRQASRFVQMLQATRLRR